MKISRSARRIGCGLLVAMWFAFLLLVPCAALTLINGGEIRLARSDVPDDYALRVWLIQESHQRGLGVSTDYNFSLDENTVCTVTDTRFVLWLGSADPSHTCACYSKSNGTYTMHDTALGADSCQSIGK